MTPLFDLVGGILAAFYAAIPNYAVAIILLTMLVMAITTPLTLKSTRSMMMMQQLQPEMKRIQARFKDDRQRANEEMLKFYKENNINPLGGCIPLLVQMPVFFFLYAVLRGLTRRVSDVGFSPGFTAGQNASGAALSVPPVDLLPFDPAYLDHSSAMYQSLSHTTTMSAPPLNVDLSESMTQAWSRGFLAALPYIVLIAVVGFTSFYQQRQIQGRNPNQQINPQTQTMMKIMPIILPVISLSLPAGLVLYFAVSNLWRVGLQGFISRSIYGIKRGEKPTGGGSKGDGAGDRGDGGGVLGGLLGRFRDVRDTTATEELEPAGKGAGSSGSRSRGSSRNASGNGANGKKATTGANGKSTNGKSTNGKSASSRPAANKSTGKTTSGKTTSGKPATGRANSQANGRGGAQKAANGKAAAEETGAAPADEQKAAPAKSGTQKSSGNRRTTPAKPGNGDTNNRTSGGRTAAKKTSGTSDGRSTEGPPATPALQPRARRPKKR